MRQQVNKQGPVLTEKKKEKQNTFPTISNIYCTLHLNRITKATMY